MQIILFNSLNINITRYQLFEENEDQFNTAPPIGLFNLAGSLKKLAIPVRIIDLNRESKNLNVRDNPQFMDDLNTRIQSILHDNVVDSSLILGFQTLCNSHHLALEIACHLKTIYPFSTIIFGGPQASLTAKKTLETFPEIDLVVLGEAELSFPHLVQTIMNNEDISQVPGIAYRSKSDIKFTAKQEIPDNLDLLPYPDYSCYPYPIIDFHIEAGRGCPYNCIFCMTSKYFSRNYRIKSPQRIIAEIEEIRDRFDIETVHFIHDNLLSSPKAADQMIYAFTKYKDTHPKFHWTCSSRVDNLYQQKKEKELWESGLNSIYLGIETGSPKTQIEINKRLDITKTYDEIETLCRIGFTLTCSFINEYPWETLQEYEKTLHMMAFCRLLNCIVQLHPLVIYPGTELFSKYKDDLYFLPDKENSDYDYSTIFSERFLCKDPEISPNFFAHHIQYEFLRGSSDLILFLFIFYPYTCLSMYFYSGKYKNIYEIVEPIQDQWQAMKHNKPAFFLDLGKFLRESDYLNKDIILGFYAYETQLMQQTFILSKHKENNMDEQKNSSLGFKDHVFFIHSRTVPDNFKERFIIALKTNTTPVLPKRIPKKGYLVELSAKSAHSIIVSSYTISNADARIINDLIKVDWNRELLFKRIAKKKINRLQVALLLIKLTKSGLLKQGSVVVSERKA